MIKVIKENPVPTAQVTCRSCGSELEYTNADLYEDYEQPNYSISANGVLFKNYHVHCPVCGCDTPASWIPRKEAKK